MAKPDKPDKPGSPGQSGPEAKGYVPGEIPPGAAGVSFVVPEDHRLQVYKRKEKGAFKVRHEQPAEDGTTLGHVILKDGPRDEPTPFHYRFKADDDDVPEEPLPEEPVPTPTA